MKCDPYAALQNARRAGWERLLPIEVIPQSSKKLVEYAGVQAGETVLDVGCGTGSTALVANQVGAKVTGLDLSTIALEVARWKAETAGASIEFRHGNVEALPFVDNSFDVVVSEFGHIFSQSPDIAICEMLRVLKPGGRLAFLTWPPEHLMGQILALAGEYLALPEKMASISSWGSREVVLARLGKSVANVQFDQDEIVSPALSPQQYCSKLEFTLAPLKAVVLTQSFNPVRLSEFRLKVEMITAKWFSENCVRQPYLLVRAVKGLRPG